MSIKFIITDPIKMRDLRVAETSNSAAIDLMSKSAVDENDKPMPYDAFVALIDDMEPIEFYQLWAEFNQSFVPKAKRRT